MIWGRLVGLESGERKSRGGGKDGRYLYFGGDFAGRLEVCSEVCYCR